MTVTASAHPTGHPGYTETLPCDEAGVSAARRLVRTALAAWGLDDLAEDSSVIVSELATNAVRHTRSRHMRVTISRPTTGVGPGGRHGQVPHHARTAYGLRGRYGRARPGGRRRPLRPVGS